MKIGPSLTEHSSDDDMDEDVCGASGTTDDDCILSDYAADQSVHVLNIPPPPSWFNVAPFL